MSIIVPAILEETREGFDAKVFAITRLPEIERIQVDFADGEFVPHTTLPIGTIDGLNPAYQWEAHLMLHEPKHFLDYQIAGFTTIILHYESFANEGELETALEAIAKLGMAPGIAIRPQTPVTVLRYFTDTINFFTILSVEPGFQGGTFIPESAERVQELRTIAPHATIEVDGGVRAENAPGLMHAGASIVAVGSGIFETETVLENYQKIKQAIIS